MRVKLWDHFDEMFGHFQATEQDDLLRRGDISRFLALRFHQMSAGVVETSLMFHI